MAAAPLRSCRSLLFLPASNPRAIAKARTLEVDLVILDCEDAVRPQHKEAARKAAVEAAAEGFGDRLCAIRINASGTEWHEADLAAVKTSTADFLVLPKAEDGRSVQAAEAGAARPVMAMIESAVGVLGAAELAHASAALIAGTNDLSLDLRLPANADRTGLAYSLQAMVVGARAAGIPVFDGVCNLLDDAESLAAECREGRAFGFDGKAVIHPSQVAIVNRLFAPPEEEIEEARRLVAAAAEGAERFEGRMIEALHVAQARALIARARRRG